MAIIALLCAVALNVWFLRSRLDSLICAALFALPLLRVRAALDDHCQAKNLKGVALRSRQSVKERSGNPVIQSVVTANAIFFLACFGLRPGLSMIAAAVAAFQLSRHVSTLRHCQAAAMNVAYLVQRVCPSGFRRSVVAGGLMAILFACGAVICLFFALALTSELDGVCSLAVIPDLATWRMTARVMSDYLLYSWSPEHPGPGKDLEPLLNWSLDAAGIQAQLLREYLRISLYVLVHPGTRVAGTPVKMKADLTDEFTTFLKSALTDSGRIILQATPVVYYILIAEQSPWHHFKRIANGFGFGLFAERLMLTLEQILLCCCKRVAIYAMLGLWVAVLAGLPNGLTFACLSAVQGLLPSHPPEVLYFLVAAWVGLVQGRIFMMLLITSIAVSSAWLTMFTIHGQIPYQNRYYMGLCVIIGLQTFGSLGIILGPMIGCLPVLLMMNEQVDGFSESVPKKAQIA